MIRFPNLPTSLKTLNNSEQNCTNYQYGSNPEPLYPLPIIIPPLLESPRLRFVEVLFDDNNAVVPILEVSDLTLFKF